jgi:ribosome modulation factor
MKPTLHAVTLCVLLGGCAAMDSQECRTASWRDQGFVDGRAGRPIDGVERYRSACAKHGVSVDLASYERGWEAGNGQHCAPERGYRTGTRGKAVPSVCAAHEPYRESWLAGTREYCTPETLFRIGSRSRRNRFPSVCRDVRSQALTRAYEDGERARSSKARAEEIAAEQEALQKDLSHPSNTPTARARLQQVYDDLVVERADLLRLVDSLEASY